jgi:TolA-binding protein
MFYNARISYDTASQAHRKLLKKNPDSTLVALPPDIQSNYDRAIEKASKMMDEFPKKKKWHDDALLLIGKANFFKGEYEKALRSLQQLQEDFPESPYIPESYLFTGKSYLKLENYDRADEVFDFILKKYPELNEEQEVTILKVEVALSREGKSMAIDLLEKTGSKIKSKEQKLDLSLKAARLAMDLKLYDKAIATLRGCPRDKKYPEKLFLIDFMLAGCFEAKGALDTAMDLVMVMIDNRHYSWHAPEILLKKASIFEKMGEIDDAVATYLSIVDRFGAATGAAGASASAVSAASQDAVESAWFQLGLIFQLKKGDFVKAKEYFGKIFQSAKDTVIRNGAARRIKSIDTLTAFIALADTVDTAKGRGRRDAAEFKVGELFWLELDLPESAFVHFKKLAVKSDSLRAKALYGAAYIARGAMRDTAASDSLFAVLLKSYPASGYAKMAQKDRGEKITVHTRQDSAQDAYLKAESLFFYSNAADSAVEAFKAVWADYPDCEQGLKALYAAGWISNEILQNNKTAYKLFRTLCDSFPNSDICVGQVKPRLKTVSDTLAARKASGKKPVAASSLGAASKSTPPAVKKTVAAPPGPDKKAQPVAAKDSSSVAKLPEEAKPDPLPAESGAKPLTPSSVKPDAQPVKAEAKIPSSVPPPVPAAAPATPSDKGQITDETETDTVEVIGQPQKTK